MLLRILQNVIKKSFINWRVLSLVKINTGVSETPCITDPGLKIPPFLKYANDIWQTKTTDEEGMIYAGLMTKSTPSYTVFVIDCVTMSIKIFDT
jgi:hypothetical protein